MYKREFRHIRISNNNDEETVKKIGVKKEWRKPGEE